MSHGIGLAVVDTQGQLDDSEDNHSRARFKGHRRNQEHDSLIGEHKPEGEQDAVNGAGRAHGGRVI